MADFDFSQDIDKDYFNNDLEPKQKKQIDLVQFKKYIKPTILIICLFVILYLATWFFFLRYAEVSFNVEYSNGNSISTAITLIGDKSNTYNTNTDIKILPGDYTLKISDSKLKDYYLQNNNITIEKDTTQINITMYPNWVKDLKDFNINYPNKIYEKQNVKVNLSIYNLGEPRTIVIKGSGDLNAINENWIINSGNNTETVYFVNNKLKGKEISGKIFIEEAGNKFSKSISATVDKAPKLTMKTIQSYTINAGNEFIITSELTNDSSTNSINDLNISIINSNINIEEMNSWIENKTNNLNIPPNTIGIGEITFKIPLDFDIGSYYFDLVYSNSYTSISKKITLKITNPDIKISDKLDFGTITAGSSPIEKNILITNNSEFDLNILNYSIKINNSSPANNLTDLENPDILKINLTNTNIPSKSSLNLNTTLIIPPTFISDKITGNIIFNTNYNDLNTIFSYNIESLIENIELSGDWVEKYKVNFNDLNQTEKKISIISIKNSGNITLEITNINSTCSEVSITQPSYPLTLYTVDTDKVFTITYFANPLYKSSLQLPKECKINITYKDPINKNSTKTISKIFTLN